MVEDATFSYKNAHLLVFITGTKSRLSVSQRRLVALKNSANSFAAGAPPRTPQGELTTVQSRFAETRFAETRFAETRFAETPTLTLTLNPNPNLILTLTLNPNFGESGFGESGRHRLRRSPRHPSRLGRGTPRRLCSDKFCLKMPCRQALFRQALFRHFKGLLM